MKSLDGKQLSGLDSMFLFLENKRTPLEVSSLQIYDPSTAPGGSVRFKEILSLMQDRLDRSELFRRKLLEVPLSLDHPYWVEDEDFDIEYHVRHIALPSPGNWQKLMVQVSRLQSQALDKSRPLWEMYVIEGLDEVEGVPRGSFAVFTKMHHATIDGVSGQELQKAIHDLEPIQPDASAYAERTSRDVAEAPTSWDLLSRTPVNTIKKSARLVLGVASALPRLIAVGREQKGKEKAEVPMATFNVGRATPNRLIDSRFFSLADIKQVAAAVPGAKVNDVALAIVSGALRRYLLSKGHLPAESLVAACPINVRVKGEHDGHDNMVSMMNSPLRTDIEDPAERIAAIHEGTAEAKETTRKIGSTTLIEVPMNLPAPVARVIMNPLMELMARSGKITFNTIVSNVAGIQQPIYLAGAEMVKMMGMGPVVDQAGVFHAVFSYNGQVSITITACREMMPDTGFYCDCLVESWEEIRQAVLGTKPARKKKASRKKVRVKKKVSKTKATKTRATTKKVLKKTVRKKKSR